MLRFTCKPFSQLTLEELYDIMVLRQEVFVVEQTCPYLDADGKDQLGFHLMGWHENHDNLLVYARLLPPGVSYKDYASIGRVVSSPSVRGKSYGKRLMEMSVIWCDLLFPGVAIKISAQCYLIRFYESFGFKTIGEEYLEDDIPHIGMVKI